MSTYSYKHILKLEIIQFCKIVMVTLQSAVVHTKQFTNMFKWTNPISF